MRLQRSFGHIVVVAILLLGSAVPAMAQSREEGQLAVRIQELEEQIRVLTGQVEGLQFQLTQMQTLLEKQTQDNEFRFQQLEGGGGAAPAPQPDAGQQGSIGAERLTPEPDPTTTATLPATDQPMDGGAGAAMDSGLGAPMEDLGASADPLVGTNGAGGDDQLGTLDGNPLDLSLDSGGAVSSGDAQAQYQAGYDAIVRGDYAFAEDQLQQFIALYPDDPNAADATNWLGEALIQRGAYDDAALVLAEGYQKYQSSPRAPDLMLKLGIALNGAGEQEVACRTFFTLQKRYTNLQPAFVQRLNDEKAKAQCPV